MGKRPKARSLIAHLRAFGNVCYCFSTAWLFGCYAGPEFSDKVWIGLCLALLIIRPKVTFYA